MFRSPAMIMRFPASESMSGVRSDSMRFTVVVE
jgi:hypothetical protein